LALLRSLYEAQAVAQVGLALDPGFTICRFRYGASSANRIFLAKREHFYEGMRMAGVPDRQCPVRAIRVIWSSADTSGLPLETDIVRTGRHVSKVPTTDIARGVGTSVCCLV
jgi:hypothetical protein